MSDASSYESKAELNSIFVNAKPSKDYTEMDFDGIEKVISEWNSIITTFDSQWIRAQDNIGYKALYDAGLDSGFISSYDTNINKLVTVLKLALDASNTSLKNMFELDEDLGSRIPGSKNDNSKEDDDRDDVPSLEVDNSKEQLEAYSKMSMSDLSDIAQELNNLAQEEGKTFEEILNNSEYSTKIRSALLLSKYIPEDLKQLITDTSSEISQAVIRAIFNGNQTDIIGLDTNTVLTLKNFLQMVAKNNDISLESLLSDENNSKVLKDSLQNFNSVTETLKDLDDTGLKDKLIKIYDGDGIGEMQSSTVSIIRNYAETVAQEKNTSVEKMFESDNLVSELKNLGKFSVFVNCLSGYSNSSVSTMLGSLLINNSREE